MIDTPYEIHGRFSTHEEEATFLNLLGQERRTTVTTVGHTVEGVPIRRVSIGRWGAPAVLFTALQHGNEPSVREAALALARDLTFATGDLADYLDSHTVHILPTINADRIDQSRNNANGVNINRDHLELSSPEARAVSDQLGIPGVDVVIDMHEHLADSAEVWTGTPYEPSSVHETWALSKDLNAHLSQWVPDHGFVWGEYFDNIHPGTFRNRTGMLNKVCVLVEVPGDFIAVEDRIQQQIVTALGVLDWHSDNLPAVRAAVAAGATAETAMGLAQAPFRIIPPLEGTLLDPAPLYYTLTNAQHEKIAAHRRAFGIASEPHRYGWKIPMGQPMRRIIPHLLDPEATFPHSQGATAPVVVAIRGEPPALLPPSTIVSWGPLRLDGQDMEVIAVDVVIDGELCEVWRPST